MSRSSFARVDCAIAQALDVIGEWWTLLIIRNAFHGMRSFEEFHDQLGISTSVLAARLKRLVAHGVLEKRASAEDGRVYEYRLTEKGLALYPVIVALLHWGERWAPGAHGPRLELVETATGEPVREMAVTAADGRPLSPREVTPVAGPGADAETRDLLASRAKRKAG
jgi:DNA-binding HxlR family transcriptional regulator